MQQLFTVAEWASLILTVALGLAQIGLLVWKYLDHGHPDARREWIQKAVELAVLARGEADTVLHVGTGTAVEEKVCVDLAHRAEAYLADHGLRLSLDSETIRMVLNDLRQGEMGNPVGFQPPKK